MSGNASTTANPVLPAAGSARDLDRSVVRSVLAQGVKMAVQTASLIVLARLVVPGEYGKFALLAPFLAVFSVLNGGALSTAAVTRDELDSRLASNLHWSQLFFGFLATVILAAISPIVARIYGVGDLTWVGCGLALSVMAGAAGLQSRATLRRAMKIERLAVVDIAGSAAGLTAACVASLWISGVALLVVSTVVMAVVSSAVAYSFAPVRLERFNPDDEFRSALRMGWHLIGADLLNLFRSQSAAFAIGFFVVLKEVGIFNRANQLVALPLAVLAPALANFLLPLLSRARNDPAKFRAQIRRTLHLFLAISIPASVWIAIGPSGLIGLVFGKVWVPMVPILRLLSPLFGSQIVATVVLIALKGVEKADVVRRFALFNLVLTVVCVLASASFGVDALAIAMSFSALCIRAPLLVWLAVREGTIHMADLRGPLLLLVKLAVVSAVAILVIRQAPVPAAAGDLLGLVVAAGISGATLWAITRNREMDERA